MVTQFVRRIGYQELATPASLKRAIALSRKMQCDRVMLFNSRGHIEPAHLDRDEIRRRAEVLRVAVTAFRKAGFGVGINNLATIGMNLSPSRKHPLPFQHLVDFDGQVFPETFCPLDREFQDYLDFLFGTWASLGADEVWTDDDFRYKDKAGQCFCALHLAAFSKLTGRKWRREELVEALTSPGPEPNELARSWAGLQEQALFEAARAIARGVRRISPEMPIGFMCITTSVQIYGSDYLGKLHTILNPAQQPLIRPEYLAYSDEDRTGWNAYTALWSCHRAYGRSFVAWPELETFPGTDYNHSRKVVQMKLAWGAVHGFSSSTINVNTRPETVRAIGRAKRLVAAIAQTVTDPALDPRGVSLELGENTIGLRSKPGILNIDHHPERLVMRLGIPLWPDGGCGRILTGNSPLIRQRDLETFAREGMLLDRTAFEILCPMARDDLLGGARSRPMGGLPVCERFVDHARNGRAAGHIMGMEMAAVVRPALAGFELPDSPAEFTILTWFEDADGRRLAPGVWTRQWRGGRLAVLPFSLSEPGSDAAILNRHRKWQLESLLEWLTGTPLPVAIEDAPDLAVVYRESSRNDWLVIGLANFSLDDAKGFSLVIPALANERQVAVRVLGSAGKWKAACFAAVAPGGRLESSSFKVPAQEVRLFQFRFRQDGKKRSSKRRRD